MGSASRSLSGNQAEKVVFNGSPSEYFGPQSAKPGLFSAGEPASAFEGSSGVVAGTELRRWNGNGGGQRRGPVSQVAGLVSSGKVAGPVVGGTAQTFACFETDLRDVDAMQFGGSAPAAETDFDYAQCVHAPRGAAAQPCSAVAVPSGPPGLVGSCDVGGGHELPAAENTLSGTQFCGTGASLPAVLAVLVFIRVTHVTLLVMLLLLSVTTVVEDNGMDDVLGLGLLLALASERAASALRRVLV